MALFQQGMFQINPRDTPETIARKRALANQIMNGPAVAPRSTADGIGNMFGSIMGGIAARNMNNKADAAERAGQDSAASAFNPLLDAFRSRTGLDANGFPSAPNPGDSTSMATMPAPDTASARVAQAHGDGEVPAQSGRFSGSKQAFIDMLLPAAMEASQRTGVDPRIIVAQAAQETGWGRSAPGNNYFGIKSHGQGGGQTFNTHEYVGGKRVNVRDSFRQFASPEDSVQGYADFITRNPRYKPLMAAQGLDAQLGALQASGYATDPNYSRSVGSIARGISLPNAAAAQPMPASASGGNLTPEALQSWAFANYGPSQQGGAVNAVNALGNAQPVGVAETEADIMAQEAIMAGQDPQAFQPMPGTAPRLQPSAMAQPAPPMPAPQMVQDRPVAPMQMAQAGGFPEMAGRNPQAVPAPQGPDMQAIVQVLTNPFSNPQQRAVAQMLFEQQMQSRDPMRQLQLEKGRLEVEAMRNPQPGHRVLSPQEAQSYGLTPDKTYQISKDGKISQVGGSMVEVNMGSNSSKFVEESDKAAATRMNDYVTQGAQAGQMMSDMQQLLDLGAQIGTGKEAELKAALGPYAQMLGVEIDGLGEAQAFKSITDRLAPQMRPVGAGSSSDRDVAMYLNSLPNLRNLPEGNTIIANTMRGLAQNKMQASEIAAQAQMGEITWQEAEKQIRALPNPYENFKQFMKQTGPRGKTSGGIQWSIEE